MPNLYRSTYPSMRRGSLPGSGYSEYFPEIFLEADVFPRVELKYEGGFYKVIAEVPGVDREDIHIDVENRTLILRGEKKSQFDEESGLCRCSERYYGSFQRTLELPSDVRTDGIEAHLDKGVLTVKVPVESGEGHGRKIEIQVN